MLKLDQINFINKTPLNQKVDSMPYDIKVKDIADGIIQKVKKVLPQARVHFMGASALGISGQGDIDIYILESDHAKYRNHIERLRKIFGDTIPNISLTEWNFTENNHDVSIYLDDPKKESTKDQIKVFEKLKSDKKLLHEYEEIKNKAAKCSMRDYQKAKYEFYNRILAED